MVLRPVALLAIALSFGFQKPDPPKPVQPDKLPPVKLDTFATGLRGSPIHNIALKTLSFSPDGRQIATGNGAGAMVVWDLTTKERLVIYKAHSNWSFDVDFSDDGRLLASAGGDNRIQIWKTSDWSHEHTLEGTHTDDIHGVAFLPDNRRLVSGADDTTVVLWDLKDKSADVLGKHDKQVTAVAVHPEGTQAASASRDGTVRLWDLNTRELLATLKGHKKDVLSVAYSPDGNTLASASYDHSIILWDLAKQAPKQTLHGHTDWVFAVAFSPDGATLASGAGDKTLRLWKTADGSPLQRFETGTDIADVAFHPDGKRIAAATTTGTVLMLQVGETLSTEFTLPPGVPSHVDRLPAKTESAPMEADSRSIRQPRE